MNESTANKKGEMQKIYSKRALIFAMVLRLHGDRTKEFYVSLAGRRNAQANLPITAGLGSLCKEHDWPSHLWIRRLTQISRSLSSAAHRGTHVWRLSVPCSLKVLRDFVR